MAIDFLTEEQKARYGQYVEEPNDTQLARYFHLDKTDLAFIAERCGDRNRFGFALQITSVQFLGTFLLDLSRVPLNIQKFIAEQLSIPDINTLDNYAKGKIT